MLAVNFAKKINFYLLCVVPRALSQLSGACCFGLNQPYVPFDLVQSQLIYFSFRPRCSDFSDILMFPTKSAHTQNNDFCPCVNL